ncbi:MAG TPA: hypothetical protein VGM30_18355 [Puia sp.]|jgi:hypothetical protein
MLTNLLEFAALVIQVIGTVIMFFNAPKNEPKGAFIGTLNPDYETPRKREHHTKWGFFLLAMGFGIQLLSLVIKMLQTK